MFNQQGVFWISGNRASKMQLWLFLVPSCLIPYLTRRHTTIQWHLFLHFLIPNSLPSRSKIAKYISFEIHECGNFQSTKWEPTAGSAITIDFIRLDKSIAKYWKGGVVIRTQLSVKWLPCKYEDSIFWTHVTWSQVWVCASVLSILGCRDRQLTKTHQFSQPSLFNKFQVWHCLKKKTKVYSISESNT